MNLKKRRNILSSQYNQNDNAFVWIFKKVTGEKDSYYILNLGYKEPLYAGSWVNDTYYDQSSTFFYNKYITLNHYLRPIKEWFLRGIQNNLNEIISNLCGP